MTFDRLRRRMKLIIWMITIVFVSSIFFLAGGSLCMNKKNEEAMEANRRREEELAETKRPKGKDELDETPKNVLATVALWGEKREITEGEVNERINLTARFSPYLKGMTPKQLKPIFAKGLLENMVNERLVEIASDQQKLNLKSTEAEIEMQLAEPEFVRELRRKGIPKDKFKSERLKEARGRKMMEQITEGRQVPEDRIKAYYDLKKDEFKDPTTKQPKPLDEVRKQIVEVLRGDIREDSIKEYYDSHKERWRQPDRAQVVHLMVDPRSEARAKNLAVTDDEISKYYDQNKSNFVGDARVQFRHILVNPRAEEFLKKITVSDDDVKKYYEAHKDDFMKPERVTASEILLGLPANAKDEDKKKLEAKAKDLKEQLAKGANFADLARANSTDKATADKGGDMGTIERGKLSPAFDRAAFALKVGEVSDVVSDEDGYRLIKVTKKEEKTPAPLAEVTAEVKKKATEEKAEAQAKTEAQAIQREAKGRPAEFEKLAREKSMAKSKGALLPVMFLGANKKLEEIEEVGTLDYMDKEIQDACAKLKAGEVSDVVQGTNGFHVIKLEKSLPPEPRPLADVKDEIVELLKEGKRDQEAVKLSEQIQNELKSGTPFTAVVEKFSDGKDKSAKGLWDGVILNSEEKQTIDPKLLEDVSPSGMLPDAFVAALSSASEGQIVGPITHEKKTHFFHYVKRKEATYKPLNDELRKEIRFALNPTVTTEEIEAFYREHKAEFKTPPKSKSEWQIFADKDSAADALKAIQADPNFAKPGATVAAWESFSPEKHEGEVKNREINRVLSDLKPGEFVKEPQKTGLGWIIARLVTREAGGDLQLSQVERQVREKLLQQKKQQLYEAWLDELKNQAKISRSPLSAVL